MTSTTQSSAVVERASTLELFLDLVFVFTVTQFTRVIVAAHAPEDYLKAALVFMTLWWIYSGYVWLTSNVGTDGTRHRLLMFTGMAGFLLMALAIPDVFGASGLVYGAGLLLVTLVHAGLFRSATTGSAQAILGIAPFNLAAALLVLIAGLVPEPWDWPLWILAVLTVMGSSVLRRESGFTLSPAHFVERHGLVVIVALGESVVSIGIGARERALDWTVLAPAVLGLALAAALWWTYFDQDDARAEQAMQALPDRARARAALLAFGYGHFLMLSGIIVLSAGIKGVVAHPLGHAPAHDPWHLGLGLSVYLLGDGLYRGLLGLGALRPRLLTAGLTALTVPLGQHMGGLWQLAACVALLVGLLALERRASRPLHDVSPA